VQAQLAPETNLVSLQAVWSFVIVAGVAQWLCLITNRWQKNAVLHVSGSRGCRIKLLVCGLFRLENSWCMSRIRTDTSTSIYDLCPGS
jgi:hypothetical protein